MVIGLNILKGFHVALKTHQVCLNKAVPFLKEFCTTFPNINTLL